MVTPCRVLHLVPPFPFAGLAPRDSAQSYDFSGTEYGTKLLRKMDSTCSKKVYQKTSREKPQPPLPEAWTSLWVIPFVVQRALQSSSPGFSGEPTRLSYK